MLNVPEVCSFYCCVTLPWVNMPQLGHSSVDGHLGFFFCFFLTIADKASMNILMLHRVFVKIK